MDPAIGKNESELDRKAPAELCQLVWLEHALRPLTLLERSWRVAKRKGRGLLRRVGLLPYGPLDEHRTPPWRRSLVPSASASGRGPTGAVDRPGGLPGTPEAPSRRPTRPSGRGRRSGRGLAAGDLVQVRSLDEIRETLDEAHRCDGLVFLRPMIDHCGKTHRVLKRVRYLVDDRDHVIRKAKDTVLLDGVVCEGRGIYGREDCDRTCFFFWKEAWLEKIDG